MSLWIPIQMLTYIMVTTKLSLSLSLTCMSMHADTLKICLTDIMKNFYTENCLCCVIFPHCFGGVVVIKNVGSAVSWIANL